MPNHVSTLNVLLYGEPIATITHVGNDRTLFAFMDSYINDESRPVLGLGFKDALGGLLTNFKPTQAKLTPFFSNLLPEETMRNYLAERASVNPARPDSTFAIASANSECDHRPRFSTLVDSIAVAG